MESLPPPLIHPTALVETDRIGGGTRIWAFVHVMPNATIGRNCNIGDHVFIESNVTIDDNVTVKNGVSIWEHVHIADNVFVGPNVTLTNDRFPRNPHDSYVAVLHEPRTAVNHRGNLTELPPHSTSPDAAKGF